MREEHHLAHASVGEFLEDEYSLVCLDTLLWELRDLYSQHPSTFVACNKGWSLFTTPPCLLLRWLILLSFVLIFKWKGRSFLNSVKTSEYWPINQQQAIIYTPSGWCHETNTLQYNSVLFHKHIYTRKFNTYRGRGVDSSRSCWRGRHLNHSPYTVTSIITTFSYRCLIMSSFACKLPVKPHTSLHLQGQVQIQY